MPCIASNDKVSIMLNAREPNFGFYSRTEILKKVPFSNTTLWRIIRSNSFPAAVRISPGRVAWPREQVDRWIAERASTASDDTA